MLVRGAIQASHRRLTQYERADGEERGAPLWWRLCDAQQRLLLFAGAAVPVARHIAAPARLA